MGRVRQPAYEILHCICRCLVVVQLEQQRGTNTTGGDEKEKASLGEVYVHLSNLPIRLLGYALSNPMTSNADLDFLSDCVFDLFFMIGIRANALQEFLSNFIRLYAVLTLQHQQGLVGGPAGPQAGNPSSSSSLFLSGDKGSHTASSLSNQGSVLDASMNGCLTSSSSSTGGTSGVPPPELVEARLTVLLQAVLQSIQHFTGTGDNALSGETNVPPGGAGSMMAAGGELIGYSKQQQAFRDVFKYFVVECSSPVASLLSGEGGGARGVKKAF
ncbi:hypothetical protein CSUI_004120 [Cystoisospora suis]|uniref:Uncharacterized protein n=1 Tax=Cystoisospora suis TaxID=483139 RepID=A0A2C6L2T0_9APIC|nr:hypothetical protein CSUI_004120 [Cystoisospora suis]